jgi:hypothetical protein
VDGLLDRTIAILEEANEVDEGFQVTSSYVVATISR